MPSIFAPGYLSEKDAATCLNISLSTIRRWRRAKQGPEYFRFGGVLRYARTALEAFVARNTQTAV